MGYEDIKDAISNGKLNTITDVVKDALAEGADSQVLLDTMINAMDDVGDKFQNNDIYVPEMLLAAKTMERGLTVLKPKIAASPENRYGTVIIGTVAGDLHDIGKNLVSIMLKSSGFDVIDLGIDVPAEDFVKAVKEHPDCKIIAISALLTFTLDSMRETVACIKKAKACKNVKIMVGGAPVTKEFAELIGADAYSKDAVEACRVAIRLMAE